jgi:hypothetical protein
MTLGHYMTKKMRLKEMFCKSSKRHLSGNYTHTGDIEKGLLTAHISLFVLLVGFTSTIFYRCLASKKAYLGNSIEQII